MLEPAVAAAHHSDRVTRNLSDALLESRRLRVMIIDDQPWFRDAARLLLHARGHDVVAEAVDGRAAVEALQREEPDAVLLDVRLGAENGFDVTRALVAARPGLPVILMSTDTAEATPERVRECGARAFVPKRGLASADLTALWGAG
jgi:DNA-binding NarL/FixJ family response regulator